MSFDIPHREPALWRDNAYERACHHCGDVVAANSGEAFLLYDDRRERNTWRGRSVSYGGASK